MKLITNNSPDARFTFPIRITCRSCKSVMEATSRQDIKEVPADIREPGSQYYYAECMVCHFKNPVKPGPVTGTATAEDYYNK